MNERLDWERCGDAAAALHLEAREPAPDAPTAVRRQLARRRMERVEALSAAFRGDVVVFEPRVTVLVQDAAGLRFGGLYASVFPLEDDLPAWCLRVCSWAASDDDCAPARGLRCRARFAAPADAATLASLATTFDALARRGVVVERRASADAHAPFQIVSAFVADGSLQLRVSYSAHESAAPELEALVGPWLDALAGLDFEAGPRADGGLRISYARSLP